MVQERKIAIQEEQIKSPKEFIDRLHDATISWLLENGGKVIRKFKRQDFEEWEKRVDFHKGNDFLSIDLLKACVIKDDKKIFVLTLGSGRRGQFSGVQDDKLRLQFGFFPLESNNKIIYSQSDIKEIDIKKVREIVHQKWQWGQYGSGEIYTTKRGIGVDCWANSSSFGGNEIDAWPSKKILTAQGLEESLNIIKETVRKAFGEDLT